MPSRVKTWGESDVYREAGASAVPAHSQISGTKIDNNVASGSDSAIYVLSGAMTRHVKSMPDLAGSLQKSLAVQGHTSKSISWNVCLHTM